MIQCTLYTKGEFTHRAGKKNKNKRGDEVPKFQTKKKREKRENANVARK